MGNVCPLDGDKGAAAESAIRRFLYWRTGLMWVRKMFLDSSFYGNNHMILIFRIATESLR
jgi:hypothetical protein